MTLICADTGIARVLATTRIIAYLNSNLKAIEILFLGGSIDGRHK
jgi:hypothetical protein